MYQFFFWLIRSLSKNDKKPFQTLKLCHGKTKGNKKIQRASVKEYLIRKRKLLEEAETLNTIVYAEEQLKVV